MSELSSLTKWYFNTVHHSTKVTPIEASKKVNKKTAFSYLQYKRQKRKPETFIVDLFRTADFKRTFPIRDFIK